MVELENQPELRVAERVAPAGRKVVDPFAVEHDFAPVGLVERTQ